MTAPIATLLVVEDDRVTRRFLADNLCADGYEVLEAEQAEDAARLMERKFPALVILDLGLPDLDGLELISRVRRSDRVVSRLDPDVPMIVLSGRGTELERLRGFERGCDDYLVKPFSYPELRARVRVLLRRTDRRPVAGRVRIGGLVVDPAGRQAWLDEQPVTLSNKEFSLLRILASEPARVFTREELLRTVWGFMAPGQTRTVDAHAVRLRHKLSRGEQRFVVNVWGVGYRLVDGAIEEGVAA